MIIISPHTNNTRYAYADLSTELAPTDADQVEQHGGSIVLRHAPAEFDEKAANEAAGAAGNDTLLEAGNNGRSNNNNNNRGAGGVGVPKIE